MLHTSVLIVGGGLAGLSSALFLAQSGISACLIERHPGTSIHPRARGLNFRTMELMRSLGLDEQIRIAGAELINSRGWLRVDTLAGQELQFVSMPQNLAADLIARISPASWCMCAQDNVEPILYAAAQQRGVDLHFGVQLIKLEQDATGVTALFQERATGELQDLHADYVIAADGAASPIRRSLGIGMSGLGTLDHQLNVYFQADLSKLVEGREFGICSIENPASPGILISINNKDRWMFHITYHPEAGERPKDFPPERCLSYLRQAIGLPELPIEIISILPWEVASRTANSLVAGRIFLVGDAAHVMPPTGAFGANTGIQDAHNLAWKLAAVLKGQAGPDLLATYDEERRPVINFVVEQASLRYLQARTRSTQAQLADETVVTAGYQYHSQAILAEGNYQAPLDHIELNGQPGTRAPHVWLEQLGRRISTLDLFGSHFVLLLGPEGTAWRTALEMIAAQRKLNCAIYSIGPQADLQELEESWQQLYGVSARGAVLVRPDGFVAWRSRELPGNPQSELDEVTKRVLCL
ncbi:FAD-binding protein [Ktedonosporobacter rubrisoli]|uniref:FAD-binding protein n=1 Tax=Ktedonosporobacter rubrisoli TaxID=2509675 RepID=A0A4P6JLJ9_KTERU|nr:FAD-dependent oxidoreductase [Ktedonosporobacter rubrisoli]QBD76088.1 FAD-binding protein [Ktedonosporobacter rubrisoli]